MSHLCLGAVGFRVTTTVANGDARSTILDDAAQWHADLIVLGSHGRKGLGRFLFGSDGHGALEAAHLLTAVLTSQAEGNQVLLRVCARSATESLVVNLQVRHRAAYLASPAVPLKHLAM